MRFEAAKKLHNEDEVIDKRTDESIKVLSIEVKPKYVLITGIGDCQGYRTWFHDEVK